MHILPIDEQEQLRLLAALQRQQKELKFGLSVAGLGVCTIDYTTDSITMDETAANLFALPPATALPRKQVHARFHFDCAPKVAELLQAALDPAGTGAMTVEFRVARPDGSEVWVLAREQVEFAAATPGGALRATTGLFAVRDISDRKAAEDRLRISEIRYRRLFEAAHDGVLLLDPVTAKIVDANPFMTRLLGYSHEQLVGKELYEIGLLKDRTMSQDMFRKLKIDHSVRYENLPLESATGRHREVEVVANLYDENGSAIIQCNIRDITARKRADDVNAEREAHVRSILDNTQSFIGLLAVDGTLLEANTPALAAAGITRARVIGRKIWETGWWSGNPAETARLKDAVARSAKGEVVRYDMVVNISSDIQMDIDFMIAPVRDASGAVTLLVPSGLDITERKQSLRHIQLLMGEVNHRAMNLLGVVQAVARQTARDGDPVTFVSRLTERIGSLAASQDLLVQSEWQGVDVEDLVAAQLAHYRDLFATRVVFDGPPVRLKPAAAQGVGMALHELATNAGKYGALANGEGTVSISWGLTADKPSMFKMQWTEHGGPAVAPPTRKGFGQTVIGSMVAQSVNGRADVEHDPAGLVWTLIAPIADTLERGRVEAPVEHAQP